MYEYLKGTVKEIGPLKAVVDVQGVGYRLHIPLSLFSQNIPLEEEVTFYLSQVVREDAQTLYGFLIKQERDLFEMLITVSGIGPKSALALIGHIPLAQFYQAVTQADARTISRAPGVGKKTAERLIIEMRDKLRGFTPPSETTFPVSSNRITDALSALANLGYNRANAQKALDQVLSEHEDEPDLSTLISSALRKM